MGAAFAWSIASVVASSPSTSAGAGAAVVVVVLSTGSVLSAARSSSSKGCGEPSGDGVADSAGDDDDDKDDDTTAGATVEDNDEEDADCNDTGADEDDDAISDADDFEGERKSAPVLRAARCTLSLAAVIRPRSMDDGDAMGTNIDGADENCDATEAVPADAGVQARDDADERVTDGDIAHPAAAVAACAVNDDDDDDDDEVIVDDGDDGTAPSTAGEESTTGDDSGDGVRCMCAACMSGFCGMTRSVPAIASRPHRPLSMHESAQNQCAAMETELQETAEGRQPRWKDSAQPSHWCEWLSLGL